MCACRSQNKFAEIMGLAVKSGRPHPPHLINIFFNRIENSLESLGIELDSTILYCCCIVYSAVAHRLIVVV